MTNALFMPGWAVTDIIFNEQDAYLITAHPNSPPLYCEKCHRRTVLEPLESKQLKYVDAPVHGRPCVVIVTRTRYKCEACRGEFWEELDGFPSGRSLTSRCIGYVQHHSLLKPNTHVAEEVGISEAGVRLIAKPYAEYLNDCHKNELRAPRFMGMDETKLAGEFRAIFIDLEDGWPIELLANHKDLTIKNFLMNLPGRKDVKVVTMDMCDRYRVIVKAVMPQAAIVVDRWHVVKTAVEAMRKARILYQQTLEERERQELQRCLWLFQTRRSELTDQQKLDLDGWLKNHQRLREPHWIKESFLSIWDNHDRDSARVALDNWRKSIPDDLKTIFNSTISASIEWEEEILNFFTYNGISSGKVENRNKQIKAIERLGVNNKFDKIRNRALFGKRRSKQKEEYEKRLRDWRENNPICVTCKKPFDKVTEDAVAKAARHRLCMLPLRYGYGTCNVCIQDGEDWWNFGWRNEKPEMGIRSVPVADGEEDRR